MSNLKTACPLDCYDACSVVVQGDKLQGEKEHPYTQGFLCPHLNHYEKHERLTSPRLNGTVISMQEALEHLVAILKKSEKSVLHYRGSGNMGLMQEVTDHFFASYGATLTKGSLCDGAGQAGIIEGRGINVAVSPETIANTDVVIVWGRNLHTTNSHYLPLLKDKTVIVIDPYKTELAAQADFHIQLKPRGDLQLALLLSRFVIINDMVDSEFLENYGEGHEEFYELTQTVRIRSVLEDIDVTLGDIGKVLELIEGKRCVILIGVGVQKYFNGSEVVRAIDGLGALLGLHSKEGCGVNFLGASQEGIDSPFETKATRVFKGNCDFSKFKTVVVQGANPLAQMPDTLRVQESLKGVENLVYFGLYENETSQKAQLVIPAKTFLEKDDVRVGYAHNYMLAMPKIQESEIGISEYELSASLCQAFNVKIASQEHYIKHFMSQSTDEKYAKVKGRELVPYLNGYETDDNQFLFLDDAEFKANFSDDYFLISPKSKKSINSQFRRESEVFIHPALGFNVGDMLEISSNNGVVTLKVAHDENLRTDTILIYSGTPEMNKLTTSQLSFEGDNALYQENKVQIKKV